jgi:NTE family protein
MLKNIKDITNIVFSGASTKIFLFIGFLKYIKELDDTVLDNIKNYAGSSSGSLICCGLVLGFSVEEIEELLIRLDFSKFKDINSDGILTFFDNYGLDNCSHFEKLFRIMIKKKVDNENITFSELYNITKKKLVISASNLNKKQTTYFSYENTPDIKVIDAVIASISIPILYIPKKIDDDLYLDGCITNHFPINIFKNSKKETIGAIVLSNQKRTELNNFLDIISSIVFCGFENQSKEILREYENVIVLDNDIDSLDFNMTKEIKIKTINDGYEQTYNYFKKNQ